jgi:outer membrane lipoprotein-sorting protein
VRRILGTLLLLCLTVTARAADDRPANVDEKLWKLLTEIDARGGQVKDLRADFTQEKFTPLLKKPLVSSGTILIKGTTSLWTTTQPEPTVMRTDEKQIRLLYPRQKVMEVYTVDQRLGSLAASPFPRLDLLKRHFTFERVPAKDLDPSADDTKHVALKMQPISPELRQHVDEVRVLLEIATGFVLKAKTTDADGDQVVLSFSNIRANTGVTDRELELAVPAGVKVTRPLEGASDASEAGRGHGR